MAENATRLDTTTLRAGREAPVQPPRLYGDTALDTPVLQQWMQQWHAALRDSGLGDPAYQFAEVPVTREALPDAKLTTLFRAQATANLALTELAKSDAKLEDAEAALAGMKATLAGFIFPMRCLLTLADASTLTLEPRGGNLVTINGITYSFESPLTLPAGAFDTVGALRYLYLSHDGTGLTLTASAVAHETSSGQEVMIGDAGKLLVGMAAKDSDGTFPCRSNKWWVRSWACEPGLILEAADSNEVVTTAAPYVEITTGLRGNALLWADERVHVHVSASIRNTTGVGYHSYLAPGVNQVAIGARAYSTGTGTTSYDAAYAETLIAANTDQLCTFNMMGGAVSGSSGTFADRTIKAITQRGVMP